LTTAYEAVATYIHWIRVLTGAELAIIDGKTNLEEIYASERKVTNGDITHNFM
jgi:hypothetical protein